MYKNEELIYTNTVDVSKESGIPNNKVHTQLLLYSLLIAVISFWCIILIKA